MNEKYEKAIERLQYHEDTVQKKLLTKEEIRFLKTLQEEMNTQDSLGNADPRYWIIRDWNRIYGKDLNNADGLVVYDCDGETIYDIPYNVFNIETYDIISSKIGELVKNTYPDGYPEDAIEEAVEDVKTKISVASITGSIQDIIEEISIDYNLEITVAEYELYPAESGIFFTHKAALQYLMKNNYHHTENAQTYGKVAWRTDEELLWKILHETNWDQYLTPPKQKINENSVSDDISNIYYYEIPAINGHETQKGVVLASDETMAQKKVCSAYHLNFDYISLKAQDIKIQFSSTRLFPGYSDVFPIH